MYLLLIPGTLYLIIFKLLPLYGITIAFKEFDMFSADNPVLSIFKSEWVGLQHFERLFFREDFHRALKNTLIISCLKIFFLFPIPIIFALMINDIKNKYFKRTIQTIVYLPHFISWVVVAGIFLQILSTTGMVNNLIVALGGEKIRFFMDNEVFRWLLVFTEGWKTAGWGTIIYLAALAGVDLELYEAAVIDGASKFQQIIFITLPGIISTIILMLILRVGSVLDAGFTQILVMYNPTVYEVSDIIQTYVYRIGLGQMDFSLGTAIGLFNSVVALILIVTSNYISRKAVGKSIW